MASPQVWWQSSVVQLEASLGSSAVQSHLGRPVFQTIFVWPERASCPIYWPYCLLGDTSLIRDQITMTQPEARHVHQVTPLLSSSHRLLAAILLYLHGLIYSTSPEISFVYGCFYFVSMYICVTQKAARLCSYNKDGKQRRRELNQSAVSQQCAIQKNGGAFLCAIFGGIAPIMCSVVPVLLLY